MLWHQTLQLPATGWILFWALTTRPPRPTIPPAEREWWAMALPPGTKRRAVILTDAEYRIMQEAAKREHRTFSNWAGDRLRRALLEPPVGRANARLWEK
jgi:hypothetical protein